MIEAFAALEGGRHEHLEVVLDLLLADEFVEPARSQGAFEILVARAVMRLIGVVQRLSGKLLHRRGTVIFVCFSRR